MVAEARLTVEPAPSALTPWAAPPDVVTVDAPRGRGRRPRWRRGRSRHRLADVAGASERDLRTGAFRVDAVGGRVEAPPMSRPWSRPRTIAPPWLAATPIARSLGWRYCWIRPARPAIRRWRPRARAPPVPSHDRHAVESGAAPVTASTPTAPAPDVVTEPPFRIGTPPALA